KPARIIGARRTELLSFHSRIYPAMTAIPALAGLITTMVTQGYEYRRDDDMALWSSADLTYSITYEM
ncbi:phage tail terminator protein, partial [Escherichia coli]|uniref:phage tail terminator protein n=1 Tax=Escherichia coli TaxID=562 RepID=UPI0003EFA674